MIGLGEILIRRLKIGVVGYRYLRQSYQERIRFGYRTKASHLLFAWNRGSDNGIEWRWFVEASDILLSGVWWIATSGSDEATRGMYLL